MHNCSLYPHTFIDFHGTLTKWYWSMHIPVTCALRSSRGHFRSLTPNDQDVHYWSLYPHTSMYFHGTWAKGYQSMGMHVTLTWRSSRGHMRSLTPNNQDMHNWSLYPHSLMEFMGISIQWMIASFGGDIFYASRKSDFYLFLIWFSLGAKPNRMFAD